MKKTIRGLLSFVLALVLTVTGSIGGISTTVITDSLVAQADTTLTKWEIIEAMGTGWNLGNSLDSTGRTGAANITDYETNWGNPVVTQELIQGVYNAGFRSIRIPVTWYEHITQNGNTYTIDSEWLQRVQTVVNYAYNLGMYVIINVHHENWINRSDLGSSSYSAISNELKQVWTQIATYFKAYDQRLIFEGMNEPRAAGTTYEWWWPDGSPKQDCCDTINKLNIDFINTVRGIEGPYQNSRLLMVPNYCATSDASVWALMSDDLITKIKSDNMIAVSVHGYLPHDFAMNSNVTDHTFTDAVDASLKSFFTNIYSYFISKDIPVIIGEYGASDFDNTADRIAWAEKYITYCKQIKVSCLIWDNNAVNNSDKGERHYYITRTVNPTKPETVYAASKGIVDKIIEVINDDEIVFGGGFTLGDHETIDANTPSYTMLNSTEIANLSQYTEIAVKYDTVAPLMAMMNVGWDSWSWTTVEPYECDLVNKIAYYKIETLLAAWNTSNGALAHIKNTDDSKLYLLKAPVDPVVNEGYNITLEQRIGLDFFYNFDSSVKDKITSISFKDGTEVLATIAKSEFTGEDNYDCKFKVYLSPVSYAHTIVPVITLNDGTTRTLDGHSIKEYVEYTLENSSDSALKELVTHIRNYCESFNAYKAGESVSATETDMNTVIEWAKNKNHNDYSVTGSASTLYVGSSLVLDEGIVLRHYFKKGIAGYTPNSGKELKAKGNYYYYDFDSIAADNYSFEGQKELKLSKSEDDYVEIKYAIYSYIYKAMTNTNDENLKAVLTYLWIYSFAAHEYFN